MSGSSHRANIKASCYTVNAATGALKGLHYSTTGAGGMSSPLLSLTAARPESSGIPEVGSGIPSPPESPPLAATAIAYEDTTSAHSSPRSSTSGDRPSLSNRRGSSRYNSNGSGRIAGAAHTITEECERLFCEDLRTIFLGEEGCPKVSLGIGAIDYKNLAKNREDAMKSGVQMTPPDESMLDGSVDDRPYGDVGEYIEVWDYTGGARFRGFTARSRDGAEKTLFIFFDKEVIGKDLKQALMALIELASTPNLSCENLVICVERPTSPPATAAVVRDLGWVGFEAVTLEKWTQGVDITSRRWVLLGIEV